MTETETNSIAGYYGLKDEEWDAYLAKAFGLVFVCDSDTSFVEKLFPKMKQEDRIMVLAALKANMGYIFSGYGQDKIMGYKHHNMPQVIGPIPIDVGKMFGKKNDEEIPK